MKQQLTKIIDLLQEIINESVEEKEEQFKVGDLVVVVKPCSTSENKAGDVGVIEIVDNDGALADFGDCTIYGVNVNGKKCARYEHASALRHATVEEIQAAQLKPERSKSWTANQLQMKDVVCRNTNKFPSEEYLVIRRSDLK